MTFAKKLAKLRKSAGYSQEDLAEKLNITRQAVYKWESGAAMPDIDNLKLLAAMFKISLDVLLNDDDDLEPVRMTKSAPSYGKVKRTNCKLKDVDIEADNARLTNEQSQKIKTRRSLILVLAAAAVVFLVLTVICLINIDESETAFTAFFVSMVLFFIFFFAVFLAWRFLYADVYNEKAYFFEEKKRTETMFKDKNYWYAALQHDMLAWFFFDNATRSFGYYFLNGEQLVCPIQNYSSFTCDAFGQGVVQGNSKTSLGVAVGAVNGISVSKRPVYQNQPNTDFNFVLTYFDENGETCEYAYNLHCLRLYPYKSPSNNEAVIAGLQDICSQTTQTAFTKIHEKLEAEKTRISRAEA